MNMTEVRDAALKVAKEYVTRKGIKSGLNGKQHAGILTAWAVESEAMTPEERWGGFVELENGSALRQKLEKSGTLASEAKTIEGDYLP